MQPALASTVLLSCTVTDIVCVACDRRVKRKGCGGWLAGNQILHLCFSFMLPMIDMQMLLTFCLSA